MPEPCVERHMTQLVRSHHTLPSPAHVLQAEHLGISLGNSIAQKRVIAQKMSLTICTECQVMRFSSGTLHRCEA